MKTKASILLAIFFVTSMSAKVCGCGEKAEGTSYEYEIKGDDNKWCDGIGVNTGYVFSWTYDGDGNYELSEIKEVDSSFAQGKCCPSV